MFDRTSFDLQGYLARIDHEGPAAPDVPTLRAIALKHPIAIPFENLDPFFGRPPSLDIDALQRKLVQGGRGGYCFEHNVLLGTALTAIGFEVTALAARVMWNVPPGTLMPRSHMLLLLPVDGQPYVVDAGFGGLTLTGPLRLEAGLEQETPHERFRLAGDRDGYIVQAAIRDEWKPLYRFDLQPQALADYEVTSWYLSNHPRSHFVTGIVAARAEIDRRQALRNTEWATHHRGGYTERRLLTRAEDLAEVLTNVFRTRLPADAGVEDAFARLVPSSIAT